MLKRYSVGLFGFGCVGYGLYHTLSNSIHDNISIDKVCIKDLKKPRDLCLSYITSDRRDIFKNEAHDFIVELTNDASAGFEIIKSAFGKGMNSVSANKKMISENINELLELQLNSGSNLLYDAACAGSIPVIRILDDQYQNEKVISVRGILNGTSNYILSNMNIKV